MAKQDEHEVRTSMSTSFSGIAGTDATAAPLNKIAIYVSPDEMRSIRLASAHIGESMSEYARQATLHQAADHVLPLLNRDVAKPPTQDRN